MDRAEAEAIYDSGRERCVEVILELAASVERLTAAGEGLEERVRRLEAEARRDSRTSSAPPSADPPKTRQQRREIRLRAVNVTIAARSLGPNAEDPIPTGKPAVVSARQSGHRSRWLRCSTNSTLIGGSSTI